MNVDFWKLLFADESHTTLNGPNDWVKRGVINERDHHENLRLFSAVR